MKILGLVLTGIVILEHIYFLVLEMFLWKTRGPKVFGFTQEFADSTAVLAANQGLYNGFLAAGLIWSLLVKDAIWSQNIALFFLVCVVVAGVYGGYSSNIRIFFIQGIPAILALAVTYFNKSQ